MARGLNLLSEKFTQKKDLKPGLYSDGGGLCLQVSSFDTKAWVFRYMISRPSPEDGSRATSSSSALRRRGRSATRLMRW